MNKLAPLPTQTGDSESLAARIRSDRALPNGKSRTGTTGESPLQLYDVHRIDVPVSGVVVYARTRVAASRIGRQFSSGTAQKRYLAAVEVEPQPPEGNLEHFILHRRDMNRSEVVPSSRKGARKCLLEYSTIASTNRYWILKLAPVGGRTHQLRVQLSGAGWPIKGDRKYGARRGNRDRMIHLHARSLQLLHPTSGELLTIEAPLPADPVWSAVSGMI